MTTRLGARLDRSGYVVFAVALARAHSASLLWTWLSYLWYLLVLAGYIGWLLPVEGCRRWFMGKFLDVINARG